MFFKNFLTKSVEKNIISQNQAEKLHELYKKESLWGFSNLMIYFGALVSIGSVSFFMTVGFMMYGYGGLLLSSVFFLAVSLVFLFLTENKIAKGVLATFVVSLTPMSIYALMGYLGWWDHKLTANYRNYYIFIDKKWIIIEIATVITSLLMLRKIRYPFLILPLAFSLWFLSMDSVELIMGKLTWDDRCYVSLIFGVVTILIAFAVDLRKREYAFWLYLFGVIMFWTGLSLLKSDNEFNKFIYFLINIGLLITGTLIKRKVFMVFGALGVFGYLGHLSWLFKNSFVFPLILGVVGLLIILAGTYYAKKESTIREIFLSLLPEKFKTVIEKFD